MDATGGLVPGDHPRFRVRERARALLCPLGHSSCITYLGQCLAQSLDRTPSQVIMLTQLIALTLTTGETALKLNLSEAMTSTTIGGQKQKLK